MQIIIEIQCFPSVNYFKKLVSNRHIIFEKYENFTKAGFRNRYVIAGANGLGILTIPIKGGREQKTIITEVEIANEVDWRTRHWRNIVSSYSAAPFFEFYAGQVKELLFSSEPKLFDYNLDILKWLLQALRLQVDISFSSSYFRNYEAVEDCRNTILPTTVSVNSEDWKPKYSQVFEDRHGFLPNLSILDLLFCEGPNAGRLIEQSVK